MTKLSAMGSRMKIVIVIVVLGFFYLAFHLYKVQIVQHEELYRKARNKYTTIRKINGKRGEIYDYYGNLLAANVPCADVCVDPSIAGETKRCAEIADFLSLELKEDRDEIFCKLMKKTHSVADKNGTVREIPRQYVLIQAKVDYELVEKLKTEVIKRGFKPAVFFQETFKRSYPKKELLANILGFTNIDRNRLVPVMGLEKSYNKNMQSEQAVSTIERSRDGLPIVYGKSETHEERDGYNLYLTVREPLQAILEEELDNLMARSSPRIAYAIMADPYTGDIIAAAQRPTYDPNDRSKMIADAWRNRIAEDTFEPGSTMKPFAVAGALDLGIVRPETRFDCENGAWFYGGKRLKDSHRMGRITVSDIIQQSSNIGTAKIALEMGAPNLDQTIRSFGFGQKTGIPLKPETSGIYRPLAKWDTLSITRFPIGQGIATSPLQLVRGYCMLANGGFPVKLRLVDRIMDPATGLIHRIPIDYGRCIFRRRSTHREIVDMLKRVTAPGGTACKAAVPGYYVAGKTGTAQKFDTVTHSYSKSRYIANFIGFVPADNPRFVLLVTADEPRVGSYYGGAVSGPSFAAIAAKTLKYMNVPPEYSAGKSNVAGKKNIEPKHRENARSRSFSFTNRKRQETYTKR